MADITVRITASGENLARVTAELMALLTTDARVDARPVPEATPGGAKSGTGVVIGELLVTGALSAASARAAASVLTGFTQRPSGPTVLLEVAGDQLVIDDGAVPAVVEKWLRDRG